MKKGFTLIEFLLYIAIMSIMLLGIMSFILFIVKSRAKSEVIAEVEQQGANIMQVITQTIRNAEAINLPTAGSNTSAISIDVVDVVDDPTLFDLDAGILRIKEGTAAYEDITSDKIIISNLDFYSIPLTETNNIIRIQFDVDYNNPGNNNIFDYSRTFYGSAGLR